MLPSGLLVWMQAPHISAAQRKIKKIYKAVKLVHPAAVARVVSQAGLSFLHARMSRCLRNLAAMINIT